jgi:hypothetical protein
MNDDSRLVGALVQGNEVILHHVPETPGIPLDRRGLRVDRPSSPDARRTTATWPWLRRPQSASGSAPRDAPRAFAATPAAVEPRPACGKAGFRAVRLARWGDRRLPPEAPRGRRTDAGVVPARDLERHPDRRHHRVGRHGGREPCPDLRHLFGQRHPTIGVPRIADVPRRTKRLRPRLAEHQPGRRLDLREICQYVSGRGQPTRAMARSRTPPGRRGWLSGPILCTRQRSRGGS